MDEECKEDQPLKPPEAEHRSFIISTLHILLEGSILSFAGLFASLPILIIVTFAGQRSVIDLDVVCLLVAGQMIIVFVIMQGALCTFQPQFSSAIANGDNVLLRTAFQTGIFAISILFWLVAVPLILLSPFILLALQQNQNVAYAAGYCLMGTIPGLFANLLYEVLSNLYIAQQFGMAVIASAFTMFIVCLILNFALVIWLNLELVGIVISLNISYFSGLFVLLGITMIKKSQRDLDLLTYTSESIHNVWSVLGSIVWASLLGLAGSFFSEVGTILAGILGAIELAAQAILSRYTLLIAIFMIGFFKTNISHLAKAFSIRNKELYFHELRVALFVFFLLSILYTALNIATRYPLAHLVTQETSVIELAASLTPLVAISNLLICAWMASSIVFISTGNVIIPSIISTIKIFILYCMQ